MRWRAQNGEQCCTTQTVKIIMEFDDDLFASLCVKNSRKTVGTLCIFKKTCKGQRCHLPRI